MSIGLRAAHRAALEGSYAIGKHRVLVTQSIELCTGRHEARWRLAGVDGAKVICGVCHPPAPALAVEWL